MLHYTCNGKREQQIVFIHGNSQSIHTWEAVVADKNLQDNYSLICVDLPGHGKSFHSTKPEYDYSFNGMTAQLTEFFAANVDREYIVVATSLGTNILAEVLPNLKYCKGVFLIGASILGEGYSPADILQPDINNMTSFLPNPSDEQLAAYWEIVVPPKFKEAYKRTFLDTDPMFRQVVSNEVANGKWSDEIKNITEADIMVALVYGQNEKVLFNQYLKDLTLKKWKGEILIVPKAGHSVQLDQPLVVARLILEFATACFK